MNGLNLSDIERRVGAELAARRSDGCLDGDELFLLHERGRRAPDYERLMDHVCVCATCRDILHALGEADAARPDRRRIAPRIPSWAFAAGLVALVAAGVWLATRERGTPLAENSAPPVADVRPDDVPIPTPLPDTPTHPGQEGTSTSTDEPVAPEQPTKPRVSELYAVNVPSWAVTTAQLLDADPPAVRSGSGGPPSFDLIAPSLANASIRPVEARFEWEPQPEAARYDVELTQVGGATIEIHVEGTIAQPAKALQRGESYTLTIRPIGEEPVPATKFAFRVLTYVEEVEVEWATREVGDQPVVAGLVFWRHHRFADAAEAVRRWPKKPELAKWAAAIEAAAERRKQDPSRL